MMSTISRLLPPLCALALALGANRAAAWGDEGHEVIGLIADHYLAPAVRARVAALLAGDGTGLVARDIASESTWADKYRDSDRDSSRARYLGTRNWHFVDLEIEGPDLGHACDGRPALPPNTLASQGPAKDCVVDKIEQFAAELGNSSTAQGERCLALEFLLHFVGDVHQPLHASDDHDQGGNRKRAQAPGMAADSLHHDWDVEFVRRLGTSEREVADRLIARISAVDLARWSRGTPADWATESYAVAKAHAYGLLPAASEGAHYSLSDAYVEDATRVTAEQLSKAGVRLAWLLNRSLK
jgi:S1/P1 Nuclease